MASAASDAYDCPRGHSCTSESTVDPVVCPEGHYCKGSDASPTACPAGLICAAGAHEPGTCSSAGGALCPTPSTPWVLNPEP